MTDQQKLAFYLINVNNLSKLILARVEKDVKIDNVNDVINKLEYISNYLYDLGKKTDLQMFDQEYLKVFEKEFKNK